MPCSCILLLTVHPFACLWVKGGAWREASMALMGVALGMIKDAMQGALQGNEIGLDNNWETLQVGINRSKRLGKQLKHSSDGLLQRMSSGLFSRLAEMKSMKQGSTISELGVATVSCSATSPSVEMAAQDVGGATSWARV